MKNQKEKIAIVTVRYGLGFPGGEERRARYFAEILKDHYDVHVITTKAKDFATWANEIEVDEEEINGVTVKRFPTDHKQLDHGKYTNPHDLLNAENSLEASKKFIKALGPYSTPLFDYLKDKQGIYKKIIYMPYLYATTYFGTQITDIERNILAPAAHDENYLRYKYMGEVFKKVSNILFNTYEEKKLIYKLYPGHYNSEIVGIPIEPDEPAPFTTIREKYSLTNDYIFYFGRIDTGKQVDRLISDFSDFKKNNPDVKLDLVLAGKTYIDIPKKPDIKFLGFLPEEEKSSVIKNAWAVALPSGLESFSITTLEGMYFGVPVIVNGNSDVLVGHCKRSNGGLWYKSCQEFESAVKFLLENPEQYAHMGENARKYTLENYSHEMVSKRLLDFVK